MGLKDSCVLWHKLESAGNSEIGPNPSETGTTTYAAAKFGNGIVDDGAGNKLLFSNAITTPNAFVVSFWWIPGYASTSATDYDVWAAYDAWLTNGMLIWRQGATNAFYIWTDTANYRFNLPAFSADSQHSVVFMRDTSAGSGLRLRLWFDGSEETVDNVYAEDTTTMSGSVDFHIGYTNSTYTHDSILDNVKIFNDVSLITDIVANVDIEGFPITNKPRMIIN
jgi:hypothetical protein